MKIGAILGYSHGFNIVEIGQIIRKDITVIMVAPKSPGSEVREEYKRSFGVSALIAVHPENDPKCEGIIVAKGWASSIGSDRAGVLESSFIAEVKSDLMSEQTVLCGILQASSLLCFDKLVLSGIEVSYARKLVQDGWQVITESLKFGGISLMMDRLSNPAKICAYKLSEQLKIILTPLFQKHMYDILSGEFSCKMIEDWKNNDKQLFDWRKETAQTSFEKVSIQYKDDILEQEYYDKGLFMVALIKAGAELAFEIMVESGINEKSAYYEYVHELPLIANTIARDRLYEMNTVISDTAEYGNYLFSFPGITLLKKIVSQLSLEDLGQSIKNNQIDNEELRNVNLSIQKHPIELIGYQLRKYMLNMKKIAINK